MRLMHSKACLLRRTNSYDISGAPLKTKTKVRVGPAGRAILMAEAYNTLSDRGRWLIHNSGVELDVVGGPYENQADFADALIEKLADAGDEDTFHIMTFSPSGPEFSEFSGRFMDAARAIAFAEKGDDLKEEKGIVYDD